MPTINMSRISMFQLKKIYIVLEKKYNYLEQFDYRHINNYIKQQMNNIIYSIVSIIRQITVEKNTVVGRYFNQIKKIYFPPPLQKNINKTIDII